MVEGYYSKGLRKKEKNESMVEVGEDVHVELKHLKAYSYGGRETLFRVVKKESDGYSFKYNLEDMQGVIVYGVLEEDLIV